MTQDLRRRFVVTAIAVFATPFSLAQTRSASIPFRIGLFSDLEEPYLGWMHDAMQSAGWRDKRDYVFVQSGAHYGEPDPSAVRRLIGQNVDLVLVNSTAHAVAAHRATSRLPIVMWGSGYPVEAGIAVSLARPGKNVTGVTVYAGTGIWGKLLELLREAKPGIGRVSVAWGYVPPAFPREDIEPAFLELRQAARALGVALHIEEIASPKDLQAALASIDATKPDALLITAGPGVFFERHRLSQFAVSKRIPTIVDWRWPPSTEVQPLLTYGAILPEGMRRAASYVVRILRDGAKAGDLPIQQPSKFELIVDRRTAKAIGLTIPRSLLVRADEVIE